jgi:hypothetical protein
MGETPIPETTEETKSSDIIDHLKKFKAVYKENINYEVSIYKKGPDFIIETEIIKDLDNIKYSNNYDLETLKSSNKFLALCDSIDDIIDTIYENASNYTCNIIGVHNHYEIKIPVPVKNIKEINFILREQEKTQTEIINDLIKTTKLLRQKNNEIEIKVKLLEEENTKLKNEIKEIKSLISGLKVEKEKKEKLELNPIINSKSKIISNNLFQQLNDWINPSKSLQFELLFAASKNGDKAKQFHLNCDGKGPTVTIVKSKNGHIFGGYLSIPFSSDHQSHYDDKAFLFSLTNKKKFPIIIKEKAVCHYSNWGPYIGYQESCDLAIKEGCLNNQGSYSVPKSYEFNRIDLIGTEDKNFQVDDYEVFLIN